MVHPLDLLAAFPEKFSTDYTQRHQRCCRASRIGIRIVGLNYGRPAIDSGFGMTSGTWPKNLAEAIDALFYCILDIAGLLFLADPGGGSLESASSQMNA